MRIAFGVSYEGTNYYGWQTQQNLPSIQEALEKAISQVANETITVIGAGRTDKGVHALGQVAHFDTAAERTSHNWLLGINTYLPPDIRVYWAQEVKPEFHARHSVITRTYRYVIYNDKVASAIGRHQTTWFYKSLDETKMAHAALDLVGEHDFTSYRAIECQARSPIRMLHEITVRREDKYIYTEIKANGFLHHMVRNIMGVLLPIGAGEKGPSWAKEVLEARDRRVGGITAPPQGLYFKSVEYPKKFAIPYF